MLSTFFKLFLGVSLLNICLAANVCVEEGKTVGSHPGAAICCKGLELQPAGNGNNGIAGTCVKKNNCVKEGEEAVTYPGAIGCCKGLEFQPSPGSSFGSSGTCVLNKYPPPSSVNDSQIQSKDPSTGTRSTPSKESKAIKQ